MAYYVSILAEARLSTAAENYPYLHRAAFVQSCKLWNYPSLW